MRASRMALSVIGARNEVSGRQDRKLRRMHVRRCRRRTPIGRCRQAAASEPEGAGQNPLLDHPILPTILRLAWPNVIALTAGAVVVIFETTYVGRLGTEALAAMALVFPFVMLTMTMSGGAMGGGVSSAIARALGAGDRARADTLAGHALLIAICFGLTFTVGMLDLRLHAAATAWWPRQCAEPGAGATSPSSSRGGVIPWLLNTFAAILRGTGNMKMPSAMQMAGPALQVVLGGVLGLGFGPIPQFGMPGVAAGTLIAFTIGTGVMGWYVFFPVVRESGLMTQGAFGIQRGMFFDILKVGAIACFNPLQGVLDSLIFTHMLAQYGTAVLAGYGIGARLEFMLTHAGFRGGYRLGADCRHGNRRWPHRPCAPRDLDRQRDRLRCCRSARHTDRDLPRCLGQYVHQ